MQSWASVFPQVKGQFPIVSQHLSIVTRILDRLGFSPPLDVEGKTSVAALFPADSRCGIYVWEAANDEYYVGQAIDVSRRYTQHLINHGDIVRLRFKETGRDRLNDVERDTIWQLESAGVPLRNKSLTSIPLGESDFDHIMLIEEQERWINDVQFVDWTGSRPDLPDLRRKYHGQAEKLSRHPLSDKAVMVLREYVAKTIPAVRRSEYSFWSCSCLPSTSDYPGARVLVRVNIYLQETLSVLDFKGELEFVLRVAKSPLKQSLRNPLWRVRQFWYGITVYNQRYRPGGPDQASINVAGTDAFSRVLSDPAYLQSMRLFNLRLMKKGANLNHRSHCVGLADRLLEDGTA